MKRKGMKISILRKKNYFETQENKRAWVSFIFLANVIFFRKIEIFIIHRQRTLITPYRRYRYLLFARWKYANDLQNRNL